MTFNGKNSTVPVIALGDGAVIPALGFGVWQVPDDGAYDAVGAALKAGYRSIDTAKIYGNEAGTGRAIAESGIAREDLFVTTKLWNDDQGYESTLAAFEESRKKLGLEYVDLYLIHWQQTGREKWLDSFKAFQKLKADGVVKSIGVSNFSIETLEKLIDAAGETPVVNQIELHPRFTQQALREFHTRVGIATEAWSPLGQGTVLDEPSLQSIADAHGASTAQVILRWHIQIGNVVIPKSVTPSRIASNFDVFGFELTPDELAAVGALDSTDGRIGPDPDQFTD